MGTNNIIKSYRNEDFLASPSARNIRILCEMTEPAQRLRVHRVFNTVVFFGSARILPNKTAKDLLRSLQNKNKNTEKLSESIRDAERQVKLSKYYEDARKLSYKLTQWFTETHHLKENFYICSGGGPGIMEAANKGAKQAKGKSVGLNISLPMEQFPNPYQTSEISFEFHYFFIRKFWFFYLAKALVVFPGGFGTLDEFFELLTIIQTQKTKKHMPVILFGSEYWNEIINFKAMADWGVIGQEDLNLFKTFDSVDESFKYLTSELRKNYFQD